MRLHPNGEQLLYLGQNLLIWLEFIILLFALFTCLFRLLGIDFFFWSLLLSFVKFLLLLILLKVFLVVFYDLLVLALLNLWLISLEFILILVRIGDFFCLLFVLSGLLLIIGLALLFFSQFHALCLFLWRFQKQLTFAL